MQIGPTILGALMMPSRTIARSLAISVATVLLATAVSCGYRQEQRKIVGSLQAAYDQVTPGMTRQAVEELMHTEARKGRCEGTYVESRIAAADVARIQYTIYYGAPLMLDPAFAYYFDNSDKLVTKYRHD